jgi:hypothetical protein
MNADPLDGESFPGAIDQLLSHPRVAGIAAPSSRGGVFASRTDRRLKKPHQNPAAHDTANFGGASKNLRADYVLPSSSLRVVGSGVFWPAPGEPGSELVEASDHRLVWVDLELNVPENRYSN